MRKKKESVSDDRGELLELASILDSAKALAHTIAWKHRDELVIGQTATIIANACKSMCDWVMTARVENINDD